MLTSIVRRSQKVQAIQAQFVGFRREIRFGETPGDYDGVFLQQSRVGGALAIREIQIL
jgi:hypothetical protein